MMKIELQIIEYLKVKYVILFLSKQKQLLMLICFN